MEKPEPTPSSSSSSSSSTTNWSEQVEDLVAAGDTEAAISLLETTISKLETLDSTSESVTLQLASALTNLANLYSSKGFSLKSDHLLSRAFHIRNAKPVSDSKEASNDSSQTRFTESPNDDDKSSDDHDDWEAIADCAPDQLLSSQLISNLSVEDNKVQKPKRRGRGTFSYKKNELYSDRLPDNNVVEDAEDEGVCVNAERPTNSKYGTRHVLVLADFSPSTRTTDLERLFEDFRDRGVVIRWVNDTVALAVFRTPSVALEARDHIRCSFTVRVLHKDDILLGSISPRVSQMTDLILPKCLKAKKQYKYLPALVYSAKSLAITQTGWICYLYKTSPTYSSSSKCKSFILESKPVYIDYPTSIHREFSIDHLNGIRWRIFPVTFHSSCKSSAFANLGML